MHPLNQKRAPAFKLKDQNGAEHSLQEYSGSWIVLYFYPKDMTPGCTTEACSFRDNLARLKSLKAVVLGVSHDNQRSHEKFAVKHSLAFPILSDETREVMKAYGAYGKKKFMGREFMGTLRNTYIINPVGEIVKVYEGVKVKGHVDELLKDLKSLQDEYPQK